MSCVIFLDKKNKYLLLHPLWMTAMTNADLKLLLGTRLVQL